MLERVWHLLDEQAEVCSGKAATRVLERMAPPRMRVEVLGRPPRLVLERVLAPPVGDGRDREKEKAEFLTVQICARVLRNTRARP